MHVIFTVPLGATMLALWNGCIDAIAWPHLVAVSTSLFIAITAFSVLVRDDPDED